MQETLFNTSGLLQKMFLCKYGVYSLRCLFYYFILFNHSRNYYKMQQNTLNIIWIFNRHGSTKLSHVGLLHVTAASVYTLMTWPCKCKPCTNIEFAQCLIPIIYDRNSCCTYIIICIEYTYNHLRIVTRKKYIIRHEFRLFCNQFVLIFPEQSNESMIK